MSQHINSWISIPLQEEFIFDVRAVLKVLFMFLPLPVFWALFDQQVRKSFPKIPYI